MELASVRSNNISLSDRATIQIIKYIQENQLQKGDKLPNERLLSELLNVSRSTIREAIRSLSSRGIVYVRQGSGTYISNLPGVAKDPLGLEFKYDKKKMLADLLEVRLMIEPSTAAISAQRATADDIQEICYRANCIASCIRTGQDHIEHDIKFHCRIAASTGNDILSILTPEIVKGVELFSTILENLIIYSVIEDHENIAAAIAAHDPDAAYNAMQIHLMRNKNAIDASFLQRNHQNKES